jgi:ferric-dicitrate binding protein FerR (iron transport regulator)
VGEDHAPRRVLTPEQARRRRRRSLALAAVLAVLALLFYIMALVQGPSIMNRPL